MGLEFAAKDKFSASAMPFSRREFDLSKELCTHTQDLQRQAQEREAGTGSTFVNIDLRQMGLGGINTWSTEPLEDYQIPADEYVFKFVVRPHYKH